MARGETKHLAKYQFSTEREEPCTAKLTLRLPPSQYEKLKQLPNWQERVRKVIAEELAQLESQLEKQAS